MSNSVFNKLTVAIKSFDKYFQYSSDSRVFNKGIKDRAEIMKLYNSAVAEDESKAKTLFKKLMKQDPPKTAKDLNVMVKANEHKVLKAIIKQLEKEMSWNNEANPRNWQPAAFVCQAYRTLGTDARVFVDSEINRLSKGRYTNHKQFCMNLFQKVLNKNRGK